MTTDEYNNALREAGNYLAKHLRRALKDIADWGCSTKDEREALKKWETLQNDDAGGGEHGYQDSRAGDDRPAPSSDKIKDGTS